MHRIPRLDLRMLRLSGSIHLEHHGHVVGKSSHCLHAFCVQCRLTFCAAISDIPVLGCHNRHVAHLEWHLEGLEGRACSSPSADRNHGSRLSLKGLTARRWTRLSPSSRKTVPSCHLSAASGSRHSKNELNTGEEAVMVSSSVVIILDDLLVKWELFDVIRGGHAEPEHLCLSKPNQ